MTTVETLLNDPDTAGVWKLVPDRSTVSFKIRNMWGLISVKGRFTDFNADGQITGRGAMFGRLDIRAASLHTGIRKRDEHLRSADFFDVERFPEISVVVTAVDPTTGNAADLRATFSIKGVTSPLPLPVQVTVLDDGPGIAEDMLPTIFERFARGAESRHRDGGSTGLGLAIVKAIVESHHGTVGVLSRPGQTAFNVRLPLRSS